MRYSIIITCLLRGLIAHAQQTAMFETTLYVKDAVGNIDSVIIGFDTTANYTFNPQFGEVDIDAPFDSILDVQAMHGNETPFANSHLWNEAHRSKKIISWCERFVNVPCYAVLDIYVFVKAKYHPLTFYWDKEYIHDYAICQQGAFITHDYLWALTDIYTWSPGDMAACLSLRDSFVVDLSSPPTYFCPQIFPPFTGTNDTIYGVSVVLSGSPGHSPCYDILIDTDEPIPPHKPHAPPLVIYPNPARSSVQVMLPEGLGQVDRVWVFDQLGRTVSATVIPEFGGFHLDVQHLPPGVYGIEVQSVQHLTRRVGQFIRTE
jgi:hypothetical protein